MRLFTFGCSMTAYHYPTWANIVGANFAKFENWGRPGAGNNYILNAVTRCHMQHKFVPDDTVIVLWSGLARTDYFQVNHWGHLHQQFYNLRDQDSHFSCPDGYQWLSFAWMLSTLHMLQNLGVQYHMFHWQPFDQNTPAYQLYAEMFDEITFAPFDANQQAIPLRSQNLELAMENYRSVAGPDWPELKHIFDHSYLEQDLEPNIVSEIQQFLRYLSQDPRFKSNTYQTDSHPSPTKHLAWVKRYLPQFAVSQRTEQWIQDIEHKLITRQDFDFETRPI